MAEVAPTVQIVTRWSMSVSDGEAHTISSALLADGNPEAMRLRDELVGAMNAHHPAGTSPAKPSVGDRVRVTKTEPHGGVDHPCRTGVIDRVDESDDVYPYRVRFSEDDGDWYWVHAVERVS